MSTISKTSVKKNTSFISGIFNGLYFIADLAFFYSGGLFLLYIAYTSVINTGKFFTQTNFLIIFGFLLAYLMHLFIVNRTPENFSSVQRRFTNELNYIGCTLAAVVALFFLLSELFNVPFDSIFASPYLLLLNSSQAIYIAFVLLFFVPIFFSVIVLQILELFLGKSEKLTQTVLLIIAGGWLAGIRFGSEIPAIETFVNSLMNVNSPYLLNFAEYFLGIPLVGYARVIFIGPFKNN